jgi:hypothetical protein
MPTKPLLTTTFANGAWEVRRPDGYRLTFKAIDATQPRKWLALVTSYLDEAELVPASIDVLSLRDRLMFHQAVAALNGQHVCAWDEFLIQSYASIHEQLAAADARAPAGPGPGLTHDEPVVPRLPLAAILPPALAQGAAPWLEDYIAHSTRWSPRAATHFHAAIGLWMLSTIAAGRIAVELGGPIYPSLNIALVSVSTLFVKTTTAKIGKRGLRQVGCGRLLAPDRATPQALLRAMSGALPEGFDTLDEAAKQAFCERLAFAGQRGWHYEEWGGMLHQMARKDSPMAEFHDLLRRLDDGDDTTEGSTIARGAEHITRPYLAMLCNATPHDLATFMRPGGNYWHDGFWPRFAFVTPLATETPSRERQPPGLAILPPGLVTPLQEWHRRLGIPQATVKEIERKGKGTGKYRATVGALPLHILTLAPDVLEAYYAYNEALLDLIIARQIPPDLDSCYGRFHAKALRIAMLLTSLAGETVITLPTWAYAQQIAEDWRHMLHQLVDTAAGAVPMTREEELEDKVESALGRWGAMTARQLRRHIRGYSMGEIVRVLDVMSKADQITKTLAGKTSYYALPGDLTRVRTADDEEEEDTKSEEMRRHL